MNWKNLSTRIVLLFSLPLLCGFFAYWYHHELIEFVRGSHNQIASFITHRYALSLVLYVIIFITDNVLALPLASLMTAAAGYFYGPLVAIPLTLGASTCGATLSFLVSRHLVGTHLQRLYQDRLTNFNHWFARWGAYYLLLVRLVPLVPFVMVNVLAGLTTAPLKTFIFTTAVGMIPVTALFTFSGQEFKYISSFSDIFNGKLAFFLIIFLILTLLPFLLKKLRPVV